MTSNQNVRLLMLLSLILGLTVVGCGDSRNPTGSSPGTPAALSGWVEIGRYPTAEHLSDVAMISDNVALAVGNYGTMLRSVDAGETWSRIDMQTTAALFDLEFLDENYGLVSGSGGYVAFTKDGGQTWETGNLGSTRDVRRVELLDFNSGWAAADWGDIFFTEDGGRTWQLQYQTYYARWTHLTFADERRGYALGEGGLIRTTDGGQTWQYVALDPSVGRNSVYRYIQAEDNHLLATSSGDLFTPGIAPQLMVSNDFGDTWAIRELPLVLDKVDFLSNRRIVGLGSGSLHLSLDGGDDWTLVHPRAETAIRAFDRVGSTLLAVGDFGVVVRSRDGGSTWSTVSRGMFGGFQELHFADRQNGFAAGNGKLLETNDGGLSWTETGLGATEMFWLDNNRGWIADGSANIFSTTDGGNSWNAGRVSTQHRLYDLDFIDAQNGWNVGRPAAMRTRDAGLTWTVTYVPGGTMTAVDFVNSANGWACGEDGLIVRCLDGDFTWEEQDAGTQVDLLDIYFHDTLRGWCVGADGVVLHTDNGGATWNRALHGLVTTFRKIRFIDDMTGVIAGDNGIVLFTDDGGGSWTELRATTGQRLQAISILSDRDIWVGGTGGVLFRAK